MFQAPPRDPAEVDSEEDGTGLQAPYEPQCPVTWCPASPRSLEAAFTPWGQRPRVQRAVGGPRPGAGGVGSGRARLGLMAVALRDPLRVSGRSPQPPLTRTPTHVARDPRQRGGVAPGLCPSIFATGTLGSLKAQGAASWPGFFVETFSFWNPAGQGVQSSFRHSDQDVHMLGGEAQLGVFRELKVSLLPGGQELGLSPEGGGSHRRFGAEEGGDLTQAFTGFLGLQSGKQTGE